MGDVENGAISTYLNWGGPIFSLFKHIFLGLDEYCDELKKKTRKGENKFAKGAKIVEILHFVLDAVRCDLRPSN